MSVVRLSAGSVGRGGGRHWNPIRFILGQGLSITRAGHLPLWAHDELAWCVHVPVVCAPAGHAGR